MLGQHDKRFDWFSVFTNAGLTPIVDELLETTIALLDKSNQGASKTKREAALRDIARHVLCALFITHQQTRYHKQVISVSIPLHKRHYHPTDANKIPYVYPNKVEAVFKALTRLGWVVAEKGKYRSSYKMNVTVMQVQSRLAIKFAALDMHWLQQVPLALSKLVEVREKDIDTQQKINLPLDSFSEQDVIQNYQHNLHRLNQHLIQQCIHLDVTDKQLVDVLTRKGINEQAQVSHEQVIDISQVQLRRIFAKGQLDRGGRFYGGWWQHLSGEHRPVIRINNKKTIEMDYSGIAINIIYALKNTPLDPNKDVYDIGLPNWQGKDDKRRPLIKKAFNAFINDEKGNYRLSADSIKVLGCNTQVLKDKITHTHPVMSDVFATDIGLQAQCLDSCVAEDVMLSLLDLGITCLPIHDSFIVTVSHYGILEQQMYKSFNKVMGAEIAVQCEVIKSHRSLEVRNADMGTSAKGADVLNVEQLRQELDFVEQRNIMQQYYKSYLKETQALDPLD
ncbi:MAG: hypothetical protein P8H22_09865 [Glaciecola sp.]|nr:hypothetical protein [Glaciecola sp.]